ncbi:MAG TPA: hypothetical protein H9923_05135 [Candidatus Dwaynia gallinarum]|nr:hypothetical protein [Candidatus Dwaynia gallinarum]
MICLNDLLRIDQDDFDSVKVRFVISHDEIDILKEYLKDSDYVNNKYFMWRNENTNFKIGQIIVCILRIEKDIWLLTSVRKITKDLNTINDIGYESEEVEEYKKFFGRVIIKYHNTSQNMIRKYENIHNELEVNQILKNIFSNNDFLSIRE